MTFSDWAKDKYCDHTMDILGKASDSSLLERWYPIAGRGEVDHLDGQCWNVDWRRRSNTIVIQEVTAELRPELSLLILDAEL